MKIVLSTESSSDLPRDLAEKHSIHVIAFTVVKGEETVKDGEETLESLYSFVQEKKTLPRTTAINVEEFKEHFSNLLKEYDAVVHVSMSHACSSAYDNAVNAATGPYGLIWRFPHQRRTQTRRDCRSLKRKNGLYLNDRHA